MTEDSSVTQGAAAGMSMGAAILMLTVGIMQFFQGVAAVAEPAVGGAAGGGTSRIRADPPRNRAPASGNGGAAGG
ncbi:hypothetical protein FXW78_26235 [Rhodococcus opacus]|nr:hypothetical protein [Rhodococcus opacus]